MLRWEQQSNIVTSISESFRINKKVQTSFSKSQDTFILNNIKFDTFTKSDFTFMCLWLCLKFNYNKVQLFTALQDLSADEIMEIRENKNKVIYFTEQFKKDLTLLNKLSKDAKTTNLEIVQDMFYRDQISVLGCWWFYNQDDISESRYLTGRGLKKFIQRLNLFMDYFPSVKEYLKNI